MVPQSQLKKNMLRSFCTKCKSHAFRRSGSVVCRAAGQEVAGVPQGEAGGTGALLPGGSPFEGLRTFLLSSLHPPQVASAPKQPSASRTFRYPIASTGGSDLRHPRFTCPHSSSYIIDEAIIPNFELSSIVTLQNVIILEAQLS